MAQEPMGYLCLVLHAHLPYVRHPEYRDSLEENWFYEAMTETYLPLFDVFEGLLRDGVDFRVTMSCTPPLASMMSDPLLIDRYTHHLEELIDLARKEVERTHFLPEYHGSAQMYLRKFERCRALFVDQYRHDLIGAFRKFYDAGKMEIMTCGATHGFAPLLAGQSQAVRAQAAIATQFHREQFGFAPRGIWNGECGYFPGLDSILSDYGIRYFFLDAHGILFADKRPKYGVYAPLYCPSGVAAFGRDLESSKSVWSAEEGYPGDFRYREFYRDIGYDLEYEYIRPYIHESGLRIQTGIKYHKITGKAIDLSQKDPYIERDACEAAAQHAGNFMFNRQKQAEWLRQYMDRPPIIVCPYDAELYGHWWFEGPEFLNYLFRKMHYDQTDIKPITPVEYLDRYPKNQVAVPSLSSWGYKGYCEVWLEGSNDWIYRHLHKGAERMIEMANHFPGADGLTRRALNQAARELLLAQSSDWAFIMKTNTMVEYAKKRTRDHLVNLGNLYAMIMNGHIDEAFVANLEARNNIFPNLDYRAYAER
jgi:1,4-alpha-glucan branching enzyme